MKPERLDNAYALRSYAIEGHYEIYGYHPGTGLDRNGFSPVIVLTTEGMRNLTNAYCAEVGGCDMYRDVFAEREALTERIESLRHAADYLIHALDVALDGPEEYSHWLDDCCAEELIALRDAVYPKDDPA